MPYKQKRDKIVRVIKNYPEHKGVHHKTLDRAALLAIHGFSAVMIFNKVNVSLALAQHLFRLAKAQRKREREILAKYEQVDASIGWLGGFVEVVDNGVPLK